MLLTTEILLAMLLTLEIKRNKQLITPLTVITGVYFVCFPLVNFWGHPAFEYNKVSGTTMGFTVAFLYMVFISGFIFSLNVGKINAEDNKNRINDRLLEKRELLFKVFVFTTICNLISFLQIVAVYGINNVKSNAFGPFAHLGFIARCVLPLIVYDFYANKEKKYIIWSIFEILILVASQGKYHVYIPVMGAVLLIMLLGQRIKYRRVIGIIIAVFLLSLLLFIGVYDIVPNFLNGERSISTYIGGISFAVKHYLYYLFSPIIASNGYFTHPAYNGTSLGWRITLNPIDELKEIAIGRCDFISPAMTFRPVIDTAGTSTNVGGIFSETVFNVGYINTIIYIFAIGVLVYFFYYQLMVKNRFHITSIYLLSMFSLSFFCNFFSVFVNFECFCYCLLMDILLFNFNWLFRGKRITFVRVGIPKFKIKVRL